MRGRSGLSEELNLVDRCGAVSTRYGEWDAFYVIGARIPSKTLIKSDLLINYSSQRVLPSDSDFFETTNLTNPLFWLDGM